MADQTEGPPLKTIAVVHRLTLLEALIYWLVREFPEARAAAGLADDFKLKIIGNRRINVRDFPTEPDIFTARELEDRPEKPYRFLSEMEGEPIELTRRGAARDAARLAQTMNLAMDLAERDHGGMIGYLAEAALIAHPVAAPLVNLALTNARNGTGFIKQKTYQQLIDAHLASVAAKQDPHVIQEMIEVPTHHIQRTTKIAIDRLLETTAFAEEAWEFARELLAATYARLQKDQTAIDAMRLAPHWRCYRTDCGQTSSLAPPREVCTCPKCGQGTMIPIGASVWHCADRKSCCWTHTGAGGVWTGACPACGKPVQKHEVKYPEIKLRHTSAVLPLEGNLEISPACQAACRRAFELEEREDTEAFEIWSQGQRTGCAGEHDFWADVPLNYSNDRWERNIILLCAHAPNPNRALPRVIRRQVRAQAHRLALSNNPEEKKRGWRYLETPLFTLTTHGNDPRGTRFMLFAPSSKDEDFSLLEVATALRHAEVARLVKSGRLTAKEGADIAADKQLLGTKGTLWYPTAVGKPVESAVVLEPNLRTVGNSFPSSPDAPLYPDKVDGIIIDALKNKSMKASA